MPVDLHSLLAHEFRRSKRLRKYYDSLDPSTLDWIQHLLHRPKTEKTRKKIAGEIAEWLTETMGGERDPPPLITTALARNPKAAEGWKKMPASLRRKYLLGIFYSRYPETRAGNLGRMIEEIAALYGRGMALPKE